MDIKYTENLSENLILCCKETSSTNSICSGMLIVFCKSCNRSQHFSDGSNSSSICGKCTLWRMLHTNDFHVF